MHLVNVRNFEEFRDAARAALTRNFPPEELQWIDERQGPSLLSVGCSQFVSKLEKKPQSAIVRVSPKLLELAKVVACHSHPGRFNLLYRLLWRQLHGEQALLDLATDDDVQRAIMMEKGVRRDAHKMKAFVRFKRVIVDGVEQFIAWHRPDHHIVKMVAPFFSRRFPSMDWAILTPHESVYWDRRQLAYGPGIPQESAPREDALEELWKVYYANTFNPARINLSMMTKEMPRRHWKTLPEAVIIDQLLNEAPQRVAKMIRHREGSAQTAADFLPEHRNYESLRNAASCCEGCDLYRSATQTVFGTGPINARLMLVGEQPGDQEDLAGQPFVGPAGEVLDQVLSALNLARSDIYITNAVKHFKFTDTGTRRLHAKPSAREVSACRPWLASEIELVRPDVLVCLGVTASQSVIGRHFQFSQQRGTVVSTAACNQTIATYHPSAVLRMPDKTQRERIAGLLQRDLALAADLSS